MKQQYLSASISNKKDISHPKSTKTAKQFNYSPSPILGQPFVYYTVVSRQSKNNVHQNTENQPAAKQRLDIQCLPKVSI